MTGAQRLKAHGSSRPSASRRGGTGPFFTPFERIGQTAARWQDITPTAIGARNFKIRISKFEKVSKKLKRPHFHFTLLHEQLIALMRNLRESAKSADNIIACRR